MTFQPPPSDEEATRSADHPAATRTPGNDPMALLRSVHNLDWALLALGLATLIFSCFDFYHFSSNYAGSRGFSAWHDIGGGGFFGWFGVVLPVLVCVLLALDLFESGVTMPIDVRLLAIYGWGAGFVCEVLAIVLHPKFFDRTYSDGTRAQLGHGVSFWFTLVLTLIGTVVALARAQRSDTALPPLLKVIPKIGIKTH